MSKKFSDKENYSNQIGFPYHPKYEMQDKKQISYTFGHWRKIRNPGSVPENIGPSQYAPNYQKLS